MKKHESFRLAVILLVALSVPIFAGIYASQPDKRPDSQRRFIAVNAAAESQWRAAPNEIIRRKAYEAALRDRCNAFARADNWLGTIEMVSEYAGTKDAYLAVKISNNITLRTVGSMASKGEGIAIDSDIYNVISHLRAGNDVIISGVFAVDADGCLREGSLTKEGSITGPEYIFIFESVTPFSR